MYTCKWHMQMCHYFITDAAVYWLKICNHEVECVVLSIKNGHISIQQEFIWNILKSSAYVGCATSYNQK
jgi:hypothetical protein